MQRPIQTLTGLLAFTAGLCSASSILPESLSSSQRGSAIASLLNWTPSASDNNLCGGHYGQPHELDHTSPAADLEQTTRVTAKGPNFIQLDGMSKLTNHVVVKQPGREAQADVAKIKRNKAGKITLIELIGHVNLYEDGKHLVADHLKIELPSQQVRANTIVYHLSKTKKSSHQVLESWGTAATAQQLKPGISRYTHASYSTCHPDNPTWNIQASRLELDQNEGIGTVHYGLLKFKGVPILPLPFFQFPLDRRRRSGLLTPTYYYDTTEGGLRNGHINNFVFTLPVYLNLAPNYDDLIRFSWWNKRGLALQNDFRYINQSLTSDLILNYTPSDKLAISSRNDGIDEVTANANYTAAAKTEYLKGLHKLHASRWRIDWSNQLEINDRWSADLDINAVSDAYYFRDYKTLYDDNYNLLRSDFNLKYNGNHWQDHLLVESYQALHRYDLLDYSVNTPYERQPELALSGYYANWLHSPLDLSLTMQVDNYRYRDAFNSAMPQGTREHIRTQLAYPIMLRGGSITPSAYLDLRSYQLNKNDVGYSKSKDYSIPVFDVDSQWTWVSSFTLFGHALRNEVTTRLYYLYAPTVNQDNSPNFDSYLMPYNYDQLFSLNRYSGYDKLSNANQLSFGLRDRWINSVTGAEQASFGIGIANAFALPEVCLEAGCSLPTSHLSPLVTDFSYSLARNWSLAASAAWDLHATKKINNATSSLQYNNGEQGLFSVSYSYAPTATGTAPQTFWLPSSITDNITVGGKWPVSKRLRLMGYMGYDFAYKRSNLGFVGVEYDSCCWRLSLVYRSIWDRSYTQSDGSLVNSYNKRLMLTFEFKGLGDAGKIGSAKATEHLQKNITGYDSDYY